MSVKKVIKFIKVQFFKFKWNVLVKALIKYVPGLEFKNIKHFAKWIVMRDSTSVTFKCSHCGFEYTDADPDAQCQYKHCPMCGSVIEGITEEKETLLSLLSALDNRTIYFILKATDGKITFGWKYRYKRNGYNYGDYVTLETDSSGDDIGKIVSLLFSQLKSCLEVLERGGECNEQL